MGNANSSTSVYNESHREIQAIPSPYDSSVISFSTVTTHRTNRTAMSTRSGRSKKRSRVIIERKARFLGRYYMRNVNAVTLGKVYSHTKGTKGVKSKLKLAEDGLYTGYKSSSILRTHVPASFLPLRAIHRIETHERSSVLHCVTQKPDRNYEVFTYRLRSSQEVFQFRQIFRDILAEALERDTRNGLSSLVLHQNSTSTSASRRYDPRDDDDNDSNWTLKADMTTGRKRTQSAGPAAADSNHRYYNGTMASTSSATARTDAEWATIRKQSEMERDIRELSQDVRDIKSMVSTNRSHHQYDATLASDSSRAVGVARTVSPGEGSVLTNDSGFTGELVAAGPGVVRAQGGTLYKQNKQTTKSQHSQQHYAQHHQQYSAASTSGNAVHGGVGGVHGGVGGVHGGVGSGGGLHSQWKSESALLSPGAQSTTTSTTGTIYHVGDESGGYLSRDGNYLRARGNQYSSTNALVMTSIPPARHMDDSHITYNSSTMDYTGFNRHRRPSASSTVMHVPMDAQSEVVRTNGSVYSTSTVGSRPSHFALVYPDTPTTLQRKHMQSQSSSYW